MNKLLLIDGNSIANKAYYALNTKMISTKEGFPTSAIYGFINILLSAIEEIKPTHIIACFDLPYPTFRKEMYSEYKATRKKMDEELAIQMPVLKEVLKTMNIYILEKKGFEADDLIGTMSKNFPYETIIISGDKDTLQLVSDTTTVWISKKGVTERIEYTPQRLAEDNLTPSQIIDLKALMGDSSDNIPGVAGVGEKTAKILLEKYSTLDGVYSNLENEKGKLKDRLVENRDLAYLSYKLATIKTDIQLDYEIEEFEFSNKYNEEFENILMKYELKSIVSRLNFDKIEEIVETIVLKTAEEIKELFNNNAILSFDYEKLRFSDGSIEYAVQLKEGFLDDGVYIDEIFSILNLYLEKNQIKIITFDIKTIIKNSDLKLNMQCEDIGLMSYLEDVNKKVSGLSDLLLGYGFNNDARAKNIYSIYQLLSKQLKDNNLIDLYNNLEKPLIFVLRDIENVGFAVNTQILEEFSKKFSSELQTLAESIYQFAGEKFNINSTKQLGEILFEKLSLPHGKKTKTGYSTNVDVLTFLQDKHEIIPYLLRYRNIAKLSSTYIEGLKPLISKNSRLHTEFKQMLTNTGRLSSVEPNLQNIPIRTEEGSQLRKLFIAGENKKLICADYSQIELRLMAHFSGDPTLIYAYNHKQDIHSLTASKVNNIPIEEVTSFMRRSAKAVNFGIIYGISDFGLSNDLGISIKSAKEFINKYFETYPKVKTFMENCVSLAKEQGYLTTLLNRKRSFPELKSSNFAVRNFGERAAMNLPLQGSASDIIKLAMLNVYNELNKRQLKTKLILQVHDELILESPVNEVEEVKALVKNIMESVVKLDVPLLVEVGVGDNWLTAK